MNNDNDHDYDHNLDYSHDHNHASPDPSDKTAHVIIPGCVTRGIGVLDSPGIVAGKTPGIIGPRGVRGTIAHGDHPVIRSHEAAHRPVPSGGSVIDAAGYETVVLPGESARMVQARGVAVVYAV